MKYLIYFSSIILLLSNCTQQEPMDVFASASDLSEIHSDINNNYREYLTTTTINISSTTKTVDNDLAILLASEDYQDNIALVEENGLESFLSNNGLSPQLKLAAEYFVNNSTNSSIYEELSAEYELTTEDAEVLFAIIETVSLVNEFQNAKGSNAKLDLDDVGCAVAVASTILVTASAVTIGSAAAPGFGTALGFWVAGKILATVGVVTSCAN